MARFNFLRELTDGLLGLDVDHTDTHVWIELDGECGKGNGHLSTEQARRIGLAMIQAAFAAEQNARRLAQEGVPMTAPPQTEPDIKTHDGLVALVTPDSGEVK